MRLWVIFIVIHVAVSSESSKWTNNQLNEYVLHYETLDYDQGRVLAQHGRSRRSSSGGGGDASVRLEFHSHGKVFRLKLKKGTSALSSSIDIVSHDNKPLDVDLSHLYDGILEDEPTSHAYGSIVDGVFDGKIHTEDGVFYVERKSKYADRLTNVTSRTHSIIYREENVIDPYEKMRSGHLSGCGVNNEMKDYLHSASLHSAQQAADDVDEDHSAPSSGDRFKRSITDETLKNNPSVNNRTTCPLSITIDPYLYKLSFKENHYSYGNTMKYLVSMVGQLVTGVNRIFMGAHFSSTERFYRLKVHKVVIHTWDACRAPQQLENKYCEPMDAATLLDLHSQYNHDQFCLAYVLTSRDFSNGVLGLAWVAHPDAHYPGGICSPPFQLKMGTLNTGVVSNTNYGRRVSAKINELTLAHEIGHSFGSEHDLDKQCRGDMFLGHYLMHGSASSGRKINNYKFSSCSMANISRVFDSINSGARKNCLIEGGSGFCGNKIIEYGEECDCGRDDKECMDHCCYPAEIDEWEQRRNKKAKGCTLRPGSRCCPSQGKCCNRNCQFQSESSNFMCTNVTECSEESFCNGLTAACLKPASRQEGKFCGTGPGQVCVDGECSGSICLLVNMDECYTAFNETVEKQCEVACQIGNDSSTCRGTSELPELFAEGIQLKPGMPCNDFKGYCDELLRCQPTPEEISLLHREPYQSDVSQWFHYYWWVVMLASLLFLMFIALIIHSLVSHFSGEKKQYSNTEQKPPNQSAVFVASPDPV